MFDVRDSRGHSQARLIAPGPPPSCSAGHYRPWLYTPSPAAQVTARWQPTNLVRRSSSTGRGCTCRYREAGPTDFAGRRGACEPSRCPPPQSRAGPAGTSPTSPGAQLRQGPRTSRRGLAPSPSPSSSTPSAAGTPPGVNVAKDDPLGAAARHGHSYPPVRVTCGDGPRWLPLTSGYARRQLLDRVVSLQLVVGTTKSAFRLPSSWGGPAAHESSLYWLCRRVG